MRGDGTETINCDVIIAAANLEATMSALVGEAGGNSADDLRAGILPGQFRIVLVDPERDNVWPSGLPDYNDQGTAETVADRRNAGRAATYEHYVVLDDSGTPVHGLS